MSVQPDALLPRYQEQGFAVADGMLRPQALDPLIGCIERGTEALAQEMLAQGTIADPMRGFDYTKRLARLLEQHPTSMRAWDAALEVDALIALARDPAMGDALEELLGPDITFAGDFHLRPKLPGAESTAFPWHQDSMYYGTEFARGAPSGTGTGLAHIVTAWIPLVDVDEDNGCLWLIPGSQRWGLLGGARGEDFNMRTSEDVEARGTPIPVPMRRGDALFFTNLTFHASHVNRSDAVRWSLDLRFFATPHPARAGDPASSSLESYRARLLAAGRPMCAVRGRGAA